MIALYIWILTAFWEVLQKDLILRCCLIHLKKNSICQRFIKHCNLFGREFKVICQEYECRVLVAVGKCIQEWWNNGNKPELKIQDSPVSNTNTIDNQPTKDLFEFITQEHSHSSDLGLSSLLPQAQGEDYEEEQFANRMKKKKKKGRRL